MNVCILDLEMNQPSNKIIQIGWVIANIRTSKLISKHSILVNPAEMIDSYITRLTGISDTDLIGAPDIKTAYCQLEKILLSTKDVSKIPVQWGTGDIKLLFNQSGLPDKKDYYFHLDRTIDAKSVYRAYAMYTCGGASKLGLSKAIENLGLTFEGTPHNALDDAFNTWRVLDFIGRRMSLSGDLFRLINSTISSQVRPHKF